MPQKDPVKRKAYHAQYGRKHYADNKAYYVAKARRYQRGAIDWFKTMKAGLSCEECGEDHPACLDFHHLGNKVDVVSRMARETRPRRVILAEIKKCRVLCANCHRKLHADQRLVAQLDERRASNAKDAGSSPVQTAT